LRKGMRVRERELRRMGGEEGKGEQKRGREEK
jgi:hypothetical protein